MNQLLDDYLCAKYPLIFAERGMSAQESCMYWGLTCGDGWWHIIDTMCGAIQARINQSNGKVPQVVALQVKEKYGDLCFLYSGGDDYIRGVVSMAEYLSTRTCENCGVINEHVGRTTKGWIQTLCACCQPKNQESGWKNRDPGISEIWQRRHLAKEERDE